MPLPTAATPHPDCHDCPGGDELVDLVEGDLPSGRQEAIAGHLGGCTGCQQRVEAIATGGDSKLSGTVRHIDAIDPPSNSAFWQALDQAEHSVTKAYQEVDPERGELKLDFLQPTDTPGRIGRIGTFEIARVIGRGGMGVVLHGYDPYLSRDVAIKILDPQLAGNDVARQRFCREARSAASVSHDNLVAVHQVDEDGASGLPFLVMHLVNGESLEQRLRRVGRLSVGEVVRVGLQASAGLAGAHAHGLIHRDIKPGNILIEAGTDKVKLTDFGLARAAVDLKLTRTGFVAGTPLYMAPEQARGDDIDQRADLFSLGTVLYEALTGAPPFDGKSPLAVLRRVADEKHVDLRKLNPQVPEWLEDVVDRLLAKDPADRFQTAAEVSEVFAGRLAEHGSLSPLEVPAACSLVKSGPRAGKRKHHFCPRTAVTVAAAFLAGIVAGGVGVWEILPRAVSTEDRAAGDHPAPATAGAALSADAPAATSDLVHLRGVLSGQSGGIWAVALSPDGTTLAMGAENGRIIIWDVPKRQAKYDLHPDKAGQKPAHAGVVWAVDFTADGASLVSASDDGTVAVWDVAKGGHRFSVPVGTSVRSAAVSPGGKWVAVGDRYGTVSVWDLTDQKPILNYQQESTVNAVAFAPDESSLASVGADGKLVVWDFRLDRARITKAAHTGPAYAVAYSPDGDRLATAGWDHNVVLWNLSNGSTIGPPIPAHDDGVTAVQFAPCGKLLATAGQDGKTKLWDADTREQLAVFGGHRVMVHAARFTTDGAALLTGGRDGDVRIWDVTECRK